MFVRPKKGLAIGYPGAWRRKLPADGAEVGDSNYWRRRIICGDVELVSGPADVQTPPAPAPEPAPEPELEPEPDDEVS